MEYMVITVIASFASVILGVVVFLNIIKLRKQLKKQHNERVNDFNGLVGCLQQLAELIQAVQQSETQH